MTEINHHEDVSFTPNISTAYATSANSGDAALPGSLRTRPTTAELSVGLLDVAHETLLAILETHVEAVGTATLAPKTVSEELIPYQVAFIPEAELDQGAAAPHGIWLPAAYPQDVGDLLQYGRLDEGDNAQPYTVTWNGSIPPEEAGTDVAWFRGDPAGLGLTYTVPTPATEPAV